MMTDINQIGAVGLGLLTALNPCPLAMLASAVLVAWCPGRAVGGNVLRAGALIAGMVTAYVFLAAVVGLSLLQVPAWAERLPGILRPLMAPMLVLIGISQTGLFASRRSLEMNPAWIREGPGHPVPAGMGLFLVGAGMALAFCPATAGSFFGVLIPMGVASQQPVACALGYGVGYSLPLLVVTACLARGAQVGVLRRRAETLSAVSGWVLVGLGVWLTWRLW